MTIKTSPTKKISKSSSQKKAAKKALSNRRKEWRFELPLAAMVEGNLPKGNKFVEKTTLQNISSGGAYFCLDSGVTVGSKLNLIIDLPSKLTSGKKTRLCLGGLTVRLSTVKNKGKKQGIALSFDEDFQFVDEQKPKKTQK